MGCEGKIGVLYIKFYFTGLAEGHLLAILTKDLFIFSHFIDKRVSEKCQLHD